MAQTAAVANDLRVLVVPPTRRDGEITRKLMHGAATACVTCADIATLISHIEDGVGVVLLTERSLSDPHFPRLLSLLKQQPTWSDVPVLLLTRERDPLPNADKLLSRLTNVTVLDRPVSTRSMVSAVRAALRARHRQYEIRDQLVAQQQAEQALRDDDRRKDEFLATLAHELRNPLAPIRSGLHLLGKLPTDDPQAVHFREVMRRQLALLVKLIDELLDVSRIATGKVALQRERLDLRAMVEAALEGVQPMIDAARHRVVVKLPPQPVWVMGDATRLTQVIGNVLTNAVKYTADGGDITIELTRDGAQAVVRVSDSGAGIPPHLLEQIFDLFAQVNRTLDRAQGGLGIGLSLVRRLMELHGGTVSVESPGLDCGSTFWLRLPALTGGLPGLPDKPARASGSTPTSPGAPAPLTRQLRVLIVDDNADAADTLAVQLKHTGHLTRTEYSGASALLAAAEFQPDVVLCDIGMPGMDGTEVARRLRAELQHRASVLVAVTGWGSEEDRRRTRGAGFDFHLVKPVASESLDDILERL